MFHEPRRNNRPVPPRELLIFEMALDNDRVSEHNTYRPQVADGSYSLLLAAAWTNNLQRVKELLHSRHDIGTRDKLDQTCLHIAAGKANTEMVRLLIRFKANVNASDIGGFTPLCVAAKIGNMTMVRFLLEKGARVNQRIQCGISILYISVLNIRLDVAMLLKEFGAIFRSGDVFHAAQYAGTEVMELLYRLNADFSVPNSAGRLPIHISAMNGNAATFKVLLKKNFSPYIKDYRQMRAIDYASWDPELMNIFWDHRGNGHFWG